MRLGLFMMPLHDPKRDYTKVLEEDREAILLAEKLGYEEAWVGEHYSATTEPITDPLQFMATLVPITKAIKFGTSVLNLPQHHPAQVAGNCAMFDHLCKGRFIMGIGPGGLGSDFELFKVTDKDRSEMMVEIDRDHSQDLGGRSALPYPREVLGHHHRELVSAAPRRRRCGSRTRSRIRRLRCRP